MPPSADYAARALRAHEAMQRRFVRPDGLYRRAGLHWPGAPEHLWPVARALTATADLAGVAPALRPGLDICAQVANGLRGLEAYWSPTGPVAAYASDPPGTPFGGDRYYDDNAWVGLTLIELERLHAGSGQLARAADLFRFACGGWDERLDAPARGGVFWVEQGRGTGRRNHDRNTVSNAPNAELGLHVFEFGDELGRTLDPTAPQRMLAWVDQHLRVPDGSAEAGLYFDKIRGNGTIDRALWSYNQGSMVGAEVLLHRRHGGPHLARAEEITHRALGHYEGRYFDQPPAFNAIFFRNLLLLHSATPDMGLRERIISAMRNYADTSWASHVDHDGLFRPAGRPATLLHQGALVQILAQLAWEPDRYEFVA